MTSQRDQGYDLADPLFATDDFRCYRYKVELCPRGRPHDWTQCPYAHPQEKAKRRDPQKFKYSGTACQTFRKNGSCERGDGCPYAHGVFECWLHPARYRTQLCTDGEKCTRRVCFFAHREKELRTQPVDPSAPDSTEQAAATAAETLQSADVPMVLNALKKLLSSAPTSNNAQTQALQAGILNLLAQQQQQQQQLQPTSAPMQGVPAGGAEIEYFRSRAQPLMDQLATDSELQQTMLQAMVEQELNREQGYDRSMYAAENRAESDELEGMDAPLGASTSGLDPMPRLGQVRGASMDGRPPMLGMFGMNGMNNLGTHQPMMQQQGSNGALNGLLVTSNGYSIHPVENQRRSLDLGEMARRGANPHLNGHAPVVYPTSVASRSGSDTSSLFAQDTMNFGVNQNDSLRANRPRVATFNPSSAADAAAHLLLGGGGVGPRAGGNLAHRLGPATSPYASALFQPTECVAPLQPQFPAVQQGYAGLVARMALQRGVRPQRTSLDLPPHAPLNGGPHRYSVDIPALPNPVPVAEAALIAGPDGYSRIAGLNYRGMGGAGDGLAHDEGYANGFAGYQEFVDPAMHGNVAFSHGPSVTDYGGVPNAEPDGFVSLRDQLAFDGLDPTPRSRQNGRAHMNGAAVTNGLNGHVNGSIPNVEAYQALQQLTLGRNGKQAISFDQLLKDPQLCGQSAREDDRAITSLIT